MTARLTTNSPQFVPGGGVPDYGLPYGAVEGGGLVVRVGDRALDLAAAEARGLIDAGGVLREPTLNPLMAAGPAVWAEVRARLTALLREPPPDLTALLHPVDELAMRLPFEVADYVDFYSSEHHASNVGRIFRPGGSPLLPNWKHLPVGYHGRSGTVVVSGTPITRPTGQRSGPDGSPTFGPSARLDIEAEVGFVIGVPSALGSRVGTGAFADHVFGVVLVNDWSARDIQAWEYQPLGPFLGKSFATSVSAWVTPLAAIEAAAVPAPPQDPPVHGYLREPDRRTYRLDLTVEWNGTVVSRPPFAGLYWTPAQQLAHLTVNGARLRTGDLYASGTVSGPERDETGSFLELTWGGRDPVRLADGSTRTFLEDGDTVTIRASGGGVLLGPVSGTVVPAVP